MLREALRKGFNDVDRAMFAAGTADRHGQVASGIFGVPRQPFAQKPLDVIDHLAHILKAGQPVCDRLITPRQRAQDRIVVRVGQTAHIKH